MSAFLQSVDLVQNQDMVLYSSPSNEESTVNIRVVNRNSYTVTVRVAIVAAPASSALGQLSVSDYIEFESPICATDILENTGLVMPPDHTVVISSTDNGINAVAYGFSQMI